MFKRMVILCALASFLTGILSAQGNTPTSPWKGTPPHGTFSDGPDVINVANLNANFTIPVFKKAGRELNFEFNLTYDSSVWSVVSQGVGQKNWQPTTTSWGWGDSGSDIGLTSYSVSTLTCTFNARPTGTRTTWSNWVYQDGSGTLHSFPFSATGQTAGCPEGSAYSTGFTANASDGSGYILTVGSDCCADRLGPIQVTSPGGNAPAGSVITGIAIKDPNGNEITRDSSGNLTDTLGIVAIARSGAAPNPLTITYPAPAGASAVVQITYKSYTVQTNFGCAIAEYGPIVNSLVDRVTLPNNTFYQFAYETTPNDTHSPHYVTGRIATVTLPTGGSISYNYSGGNQGIECVDGSTAGFTRTTPDGVWTYSRTMGTFPASTTTITDPQSNQRVVQFLGNYQTVDQRYSSSGTLLKTLSTCYDGLTTNCATTAFGTPISQKAVTLQLDGLVSKSVYFYKPEGLLTEVDEYDFGSGAVGPLIQKTLNTYGNWSDGTNTKLATVTVQDGVGTQIAKTSYTYDEGTPVATSGLPQRVSAATSRRNLTTISRWLNTTGALISNRQTYFDTGMLNVATDPNLHPTTYSYSAAFASAYPTTVANALNQSTAFNYDIRSGVVTSMTDLNNQVTSFNYDSMLRPTTTNFPDGGLTTLAYNDSAHSTTSTVKMTSTQNVVHTTQFDGLGRVSQEQTNSIYVDTTYDSLGRVHTVSNPHGTAGSSTDGITTYNYDSLGRICVLIPPDGTLPSTNCPLTAPLNDVFTSYFGNTSTVTDQAGKTRKRKTDGLGRLTSVWEDPGGLNYLTSYVYGSFGNLSSVLQVGSRPRTFTYNSLSQLLTAINPESGTTTYTYDNNGNVLTRKDARNITTTYTYDTLNRNTRKSYSDGTPTANFYFDAAPSFWAAGEANTVGRLVEATTSNTATEFSYDPVGRIAQRVVCTPLNCTIGANGQVGQGWSYYYTYNLAGGMIQFNDGVYTWPQSFNQIFDSAGRVTQITSTVSDTQHPATFFTVDAASGYWPNGALRKATLGNGLTLSTVYNKRLQPCLIDVANNSALLLQTCNDSSPTGNVLDLYMNYNLGVSDNGNVVGWNATGGQAFVRTYGYDALNRVSTFADSAAAQPCKGLSWTYDAWGNRTDQTVTAGTCGTFHNAVDTNNRLVGAPYQYDAAGNMIHDASHSYAYDAENRVTSVDGGTTGTYIYDAFGRRAKRTVGASSYEYVYDNDGNIGWELLNGSVNHAYIHSNGRLLAEYFEGTTYFAQPDHLGSTRLLTKMDKSVRECDDYYPYGESISCGVTTGTTLKFTGKERDTESGLDNFGARYMNSSMGRFIASDPSNLSVDFFLPQTWNRYAYVLNNPLAIVDRNGLWPTYIHNEIINEAFPGMSDAELQTLRQASYDTDYNNRINGHGPQDPESSFVHGMSDGVHNQDPAQAQQEGDAFIAQNEHDAQQIQADWVASGNTGFAPGALTAFGNALHTIEDRLSPSHVGNQPWYGTQGAKNKYRALQHVQRESVINDAQKDAAIAAARAAFRRMFGNMGLLAIQPRTACTTIQGPNGPETHCE